MDSEFVLHAAQWVMAEFVRIFHDTDLDTATKVVDALVERTIPLIWQVGGARRILNPSMNLSDSTLLLLHAATGPTNEQTLAKDLEQSRLPNYRRVLRNLHTKRLVEYNESTGAVTLSPLGVKSVEDRILAEKT
jgi:hypothetical protein